jgi:hypothetical protein
LKGGLVFVLLASSLLFPSIAFGEPGSASVQVNGSTFKVNYDATGLTVDGMEADASTSTLTVLITTTDVSPVLKITLDRSFFDSKTDGVDDDFFVLAGIDEAEFVEDRHETTRVLTISVPPGANSIDIIALGASGFGSEVAPQEPVEIPEEIPQVPPQQSPVEEPPAQEPQTQCGPGTVLKDGVCVLEEIPRPTPQEPPSQEPQTQCGPGTVLKDGVCVLDERCGPGTVFKDGMCVLEETPQPTAASRGKAFELLVPAVAAFIIAFIIMIILWAIGRASRKKNT